jgi:2-dehydropantoate 2-reductase
VIDASILVLGGGAIGGVTAARLTGAVRRVAVLDADPAHVARMRDPGLEIDDVGTPLRVALDAVDDRTALPGPFDVALIAVKAPWHRAALEPLLADGPEIAAFASMGNGLIQDGLAELVGPERLLTCIVEWGGTNLGPGRLVRDTAGSIVVGELDGEVRDRTTLLARCLEAVGEVRLTRDIRGHIWSKLIVNSTFTGLSAISGLRYGGVAAHPDGREAVYALWAEGFAVAQAEGAELDEVMGIAPREIVLRSPADRPAADATLGRMMDLAGNVKPSMLQDLEKGATTEVDVVNGGVASRGRAHGIATPANDAVVALVHAMERGERRPDPSALAEVPAP